MRHNSFANKYSDVYIGGYRVGPKHDLISEFFCDVFFLTGGQLFYMVNIKVESIYERRVMNSSPRTE